ncbi:MAG: glycosyltransferase family 39 protein [Planctomycetota bacterium]|nr:glycosyltransferase family 39 protein [Planctomycetota bacterium]
MPGAEPKASGGFRVVWVTPLLVGLGLRGILAGFTGRPSVDGAAFLLPLAEEFLDGDFQDWRWGTFPPLYPAIVAAFRLIVGDLVLAGQVVSVLAGALTIIPGALLAGRLVGPRATAPAAWLLAALPLACQYSARPQTEALYALFIASGLYAFVRLLDEPSVILASILGTAAGLAAATRPEGAGMILAGCGAILAHRRGPWGWRIVALILPFIVLSIPGALITKQVTGRWKLSSKAGYIFYRNLQDNPDEFYFRLTPDREHLLFETYIRPPEGSRPFADLPVEPGRVVSRYASSLGRMLLNFPRVFDVPLIFLALLGVLISPRPRWTRSGRAVAILLVAYLIVLPIFSSERRFWVPLLPILIPLAARGLLSIPARWRRASLIATILILLPHAGSPVRDQGYSWRDSPERRLARLVGPEATVLSQDGRVAIFAGARHVFLPVAPADDLIEFAKRKGARFLAVDPARLETRRPGLLPDLGDRLEKLGEESGRDRTIVLYRLR